MIHEILNNIKPANTNFIGTEFENWYNLPSTSKGKVGEDITKALMEANGTSVGKRKSSKHDAIIDGKKVEIKTAFMKMDGTYVVYGYDPTEDPHYWLFTLVDPTGINVYKLDRKSMSNVYLGKSRHNIMMTVNPSKLLDAGGTIVASYTT